MGLDSTAANSARSSSSWMSGTCHLKCMMSHVLSPLLWPLLCHFFLLPDSGGCARKRAAMSVTLTSVKRVQSSPNLLAAGIISLTHRVSHSNGFI